MHCDDNQKAESVKSTWQQVLLQAPRPGQAPPVAFTPELQDLLARGAAVAVGVSGGKDSDACAIAVARYLDAIGHTGPRVLVHSDLGRVEWRQSLPQCEDLARHLGWELLVVRRRAGDMLARWQGRWANNLARYAALESVRLILPWSTPSMRFCTSELKTDVISSALKKRFPGLEIVNATGIRREESATRARMPVAAAMAKLQRRGLAGMSWNPIIEWTLTDVLRAIAGEGLQLHEAYTCYDASRVSCAYCIMSTQRDLRAAAVSEDNHEVYREMVELEARSTFAFQGNYWLADVAPHLLPAHLKERVQLAKAHAKRRQVLDAAVPKHLLFVPGKPVPQAIPTWQEAEQLAAARREILQMLGVQGAYTDAGAVRDRYQQLLDAVSPVLAIQESDDDEDTEYASERACA